MKVLLDECLPRGLRKHLLEHECETVPKAGLAGKRNGELLELAERAGWQILLTVDQAIPYQQNLTGRSISLIVVHAKSNRLPDLLPYVPALLSALKTIRRGQDVRIP